MRRQQALHLGSPEKPGPALVCLPCADRAPNNAQNWLVRVRRTPSQETFTHPIVRRQDNQPGSAAPYDRARCSLHTVTQPASAVRPRRSARGHHATHRGGLSLSQPRLYPPSRAT
eukprot:6203201-Pleurochrysis_carterae.AAC.1